MSKLTIAKAITAGLTRAMEDDPKVMLMGEDIGSLGGVYRVTEGLKARFGAHRVLDSPLGEAGIVGTASPEALDAHTAGRRIITPSNAHDAYWMEQQAIASDDPVIIFEPKRRYWLKDEVDETAEPTDPFSASVIREGEDATVVAWGPLVPVALAAANAAEEDGRSVEVIDLRSISPIDFDTLTASVRKTGRLVIAHEAPTFGGLGGEIAARVTEQAFYSLEAPVLRVGAFHMPYPPAAVEEHYVPDLDRVLDALDRSFTY